MTINQIFTWIIILLVVVILILLMLLYIKKYNHKYSRSSENEVKYFTNMLDLFYTGHDINQNISDLPIYVINMDKSHDRRKNVIQQAKYYNIMNNINFIQAVDGSNTKLAKTAYGLPLKFSNNCKTMSSSEVGCTLSHIKAAETCYKNNHDYALIIEDDISFCLMPFWKDTLQQIMSQAPADWEIISVYKSCPSVKWNGNNFLEYNLTTCWGTVAYILSRKACEKIVSSCINPNTGKYILSMKNPHRASLASDEHIFFICKTYVYNTSLFIPNNINMKSTIHDWHSEGHVNNSLGTLKEYYNMLKFPYHPNIPQILHIIWIGPNKIPKTISSWTRDFKDKTGWQVKIWRDKDIDNLHLQNQREYNNMTEYCGKADIARYEILYRYGGMYIDADTIWLGKDISPQLLQGMFNVFRENEKSLANGWIASIPGHPFLKLIIDNIPKSVKTGQEPWITTGPRLLHNLYMQLENVSTKDINIVPWNKVLCPSDKDKNIGNMGWHGIDKSNYDILLKNCKNKSQAFAFHWGYSTNKMQI